MRISTARDHKPGSRWVRITNFVMPNASAIHGSPLTDPRKKPIPENCGYQINWHVPIDDDNHWKYVIGHRFDGPVDNDFMMGNFDDVDENFYIPLTRETVKQDRNEMKYASSRDSARASSCTINASPKCRARSWIARTNTWAHRSRGDRDAQAAPASRSKTLPPGTIR